MAILRADGTKTSVFDTWVPLLALGTSCLAGCFRVSMYDIICLQFEQKLLHRRKELRDDHRRHRRTAGRPSRGPTLPSSAARLFPSDLSLKLGLGYAVLGPAPATAQFPVVCRRCHANCRGLPYTSHHLGKARSASLVAPLCALASRRAMVPGGRARRCGSDVFGFCGRARSPCRFRRSGLELCTFIPDFVCLRPLHSS